MWTSRTLPYSPVAGLPRDQLERLGAARDAAYDALVAAEEEERGAQAARKAAKVAVEHFKAEWEAAMSDPLFDIE